MTTVLGIETSCDETAAAVVDGGFNVRSNAVYTQVARHARYGGVVPEIASRAHLEVLPDIVEGALRDAGADWGDLNGVAVTKGPGLATSLLVGLTCGRAVAYRLGIPCLGVHHIEAHIHALYLSPDVAPPEDGGPLMVLLVSGGHTELIEVDGLRSYRTLGRTTDDAAGEALDKGASLLGLGYPGGPAIEKTAADGDPNAVRFPRGDVRSDSKTGALHPEYCFSFSGVKTALLYHLREHPLDPGDDQRRSDLAASYQEAVVDSLIRKLERALDDYPDHRVACAGGVGRNRRLRERLEAVAEARGRHLILTDPAYCTDNAAMIAGLGGVLLERGENAPADGIRPSWAVGGEDRDEG